MAPTTRRYLKETFLQHSSNEIHHKCIYEEIIPTYQAKIDGLSRHVKELSARVQDKQDTIHYLIERLFASDDLNDELSSELKQKQALFGPHPSNRVRLCTHSRKIKRVIRLGWPKRRRMTLIRKRFTVKMRRMESFNLKRSRGKPLVANVEVKEEAGPELKLEEIKEEDIG